MSAPRILFGGFLVLLALLIAAFAWDSLRTLGDAYREVKAADQEVALQEERFLDLLPTLGLAGVVSANLLEGYRQAEGTAARRETFQKILAEVSGPRLADPGDPLARHAADEYVGSLNRRQVALRRQGEAAAEYDRLAEGFRGRIATGLADLPKRMDR